MNEFNLQRSMIIKAANALGDDILKEVVFIGGCITGLLITDDLIREQIRHTFDVDVIINIATQTDLAKFEKSLRNRGFVNNIEQDAHIASWKFKDLYLDIISVNSKLPSSAQGWCQDAYDHSQQIALENLSIKIASPIYFLAMKLEAYKDRGNNDPLESRDIEDILNLFDGRDEIISELKNAQIHLQKYISDELKNLLNNKYFSYAIQSTTQSDSNREEYLFEKIKLAIYK